MPTIHPRRAALLGLGLFALAAPTAHAASYEQISRATGASGKASPFASFPLFASDGGTTGSFGRFDLGYSQPTLTGLYTRSIVSNTTGKYPETGTWTLGGIDRTEKIGLFVSINGFSFSLSVGRLDDPKQAKVVGTAAAAAAISYSLSGDGKTVAIADGTGVRTVDVATLATKKLTTSYVALGPRSLSDDGTILVGSTNSNELSLDPDGGVIIRDGKVTQTGGATIVSPDGSNRATLTIGATSTLTVRNLITGAQFKSNIPGIVGPSPRPLWISATGDQVAVTPSFRPGTAQVYSTTTKRWTKFGGPYAEYFDTDALIGVGPSVNNSISRNGRFGELTLGDGQVALVDLTGADLTGGGDALSAGNYLSSQGVTGCGATATFAGHFATPAPWVAAPKSGSLRITADGTLLKKATSTTPTAFDAANDPAWNVKFPAGAQLATITYTAVDAENRTVTSTTTAPLPC